jgi:hypothetical protein
VGEDLVDDRRLRHESHDAHRDAAGGTRERGDLEELLQAQRPSAAGVAFTRLPPGRFAHQLW